MPVSANECATVAARVEGGTPVRLVNKTRPTYTACVLPPADHIDSLRRCCTTLCALLARDGRRHRPPSLLSTERPTKVLTLSGRALVVYLVRRACVFVCTAGKMEGGWGGSGIVAVGNLGPPNMRLQGVERQLDLAPEGPLLDPGALGQPAKRRPEIGLYQHQTTRWHCHTWQVSLVASFWAFIFLFAVSRSAESVAAVVSAPATRRPYAFLPDASAASYCASLSRLS